MGEGFVVDRCVCHSVTLGELKALADELRARTGLEVGVQDLSRRTGCCTGCGMCRVYVERMLRTGETELPLLAQPDRG